MKYLNLSQGFNPYNAKPEDCIDFELIKFSGGEPHIKLQHPKDYFITITHRINNPDDMFVLILAVDALRRMFPVKEINLFIPYFPGARQDRIMVEGEPLTVKIYADLINDLMLDSVTILDPHSEVTPALINDVKIINNHDFVLECLKDLYPQPYAITPLLISPDAGSNKKIKDLAKFLYGYQSNINIVKCDKTRDISTGKITGFEVYSDNLAGMDCVIVDDICANGGTFIGLVKELKIKGAGNIYLVVTHGEFGSSRPITFQNLTKVFKCIYCTDSIFNMDEAFYDQYKHYDNVKMQDKVKQIKIADIL